MKKQKLLLIIFYSVVFVAALTLWLVLGLSANYQLKGGLVIATHAVINVFALLAILYTIFLVYKDHPKTKNLFFLYATVILQIVPIAIRLISLENSKLNNLTKNTAIWAIVVAIISIASYISIYWFSDLKEEEVE